MVFYPGTSIQVSSYPAHGIIPFVGVNLFVAVTFIGLRCWARLLSAGRRFRLDDWLAICILFPALVGCVLIILIMNNGIGDHAPGLQLAPIEQDLLYFYIINLLWNLSMLFIRFSVLAFYYRIFVKGTNHDRIWKGFYYAVVFLSFAWALGVMGFNALFVCNPIKGFWDLSVPRPQCFDYFTIFEIGTVGDLINDMLILLLPLPQVLRLRVSLGKRLLICMSFILGYGVAFLAVGHLATSFEISPTETDTDLTFYLVPHLYWCIAQIGLSILSICLPATFQLIRHCKQYGGASALFKRPDSFPTHYVLSGTTMTSSRQREPHCNLWSPSWDNIYDEPMFGTYVTITAGGPKEKDLESGETHDMAPLKGISVKSNFTVEETSHFDFSR